MKMSYTGVSFLTGPVPKVPSVKDGKIPTKKKQTSETFWKTKPYFNFLVYVKVNVIDATDDNIHLAKDQASSSVS